MTRDAEAFFGGVLEALPALTAIACPSVVSYERLQPHRWSGAWATWGVENREAALRFIPGMVGTRDRRANMELKIVDGAANPYLVIGAVIAAGIAGLDRGAALPPGTDGDPASHEQTAAAAGRIRRLPISLAEAVDAFEDSDLLRASLGEVLFDAFRLARRAEIDAFEGVDPVDVIRFHRWRY
jgi:glutamine synthetase